MQPADRSDLGGVGMVLLNKCQPKPRVVEGALAENLGKEAAVIAELSIGSEY